MRLRLFVALDIPDGTRKQLAAAIAQFSRLCRGARWMHAESMHVTLKFIGEVEEEELTSIEQTLDGIPPRAPITIAFRHFGFFPNDRRPRVFWAGIESGPELGQLAAEIDAGLSGARIQREEKSFRPHLTLARFKSSDGLAKLREMIAPPASRISDEFGSALASEFHLYQSVLKSAGAEYIKLRTWRLSGAAA